MNNKKFKIGDKVRIIKCDNGVEPYELNKIGIIVNPNIKGGLMGDDYIMDMGRPRRVDEPETCWWVKEHMIELATKRGRQLLFDFMYIEG